MVIKNDWIKCQEGLYAEIHSFIFKGQVRVRYNIYSADGYCFYSLDDEEEYPSYSTMAYTPCTSIDEINNTFKSIPVSEQKVMEGNNE